MSDRTTAHGLPDDLGERIADWYAELTWRRGTTIVQPDDRTWVLLSPQWPRSYANNGILVRADPGGEELLAWGDELLGGAGLEHRHVFALCDLAPGTRATLAAAGYSVEAEVIQVRPTSAGPLRAPDGVMVEVVPLDEVDSLHETLWHEEWMPEADHETVRQLIARRSSYSLSGEMVTLLVRDPETGDPAATTDVCLAGWAAEVDGVATRERFRGRGYGDAMLATAVQIAADRGCEHVALTAMVEDWPKDWYARRGFLTVGPGLVGIPAPGAARVSAPHARVVLLCGPSGSGKTHIAARSGLPVFRLDDFYKDGDDPTLPFSPELGIVDWDDVGAWHAERAVEALVTLCREGAVEVPAYDISQSRAVGSSVFTRGSAPAVVAEGVFAAEIIEQCRERGILADAVVLHRAPWKNFVRRFARDLAERRKPPATLWRRGRLLMHDEPAMVATAEAKGCRRVDARGLARLLAGLATPVDA